MADFYCYVQNGVIERYNITKPKAHQLPDGSNHVYGTNVTDAELAADGYFPIVGEAPVYDSATQRLEGPVYAVGNGVVTRSYTANEIPRVELTEPVWDAIKVERERRKESGFSLVVNGVTHWFHSDAGSKMQHFGNKDTARDQLESGSSMASPLLDPTTGQAIAWKTLTPEGAPEFWLPLTCQLAFDIVKAGKAADFAQHRAAVIHKAAMEASESPASYSFMQDAGKTKWPVVFGE